MVRGRPRNGECMSLFSEEFDLDKTRDRATAPDDAQLGEDPRLSAMLGGPREQASARDSGTDTIRLSTIVDAAAVGGAPSGIAAVAADDDGGKAKKARGHRRIDWINVVTASVAVVATVSAVVFAGVQIANASPADDAMQVLTTEESTLAGAENSLKTSKSRLEEKIQTADADTALVRTAMSAMAATADQPATADVAALNTVIQAVDGYRTALAEIVLPDLPYSYVRPILDEESLESVGQNLDRVQVRSAEVDAIAQEMRKARTSLDDLTGAYRAQLAAFAATLPQHAVVELEANTVAGDEFRTAVTTAAATVAAAQLDTAAGASTLTAYRGAVLALRAEDLRVRTEQEAQRIAEEEQNNWNSNSNNNWNEQPPAPTDPGTDPGITNPGPTDPGPTDPGPTDPGPTDPGPTDPGDDTETPLG